MVSFSCRIGSVRFAKGSKDNYKSPIDACLNLIIFEVPDTFANP